MQRSDPKRRALAWLLASFVTLALPAGRGAAEWPPTKAPLMTRWAKDVSPEKVHPEYPRPQLVRPSWVNLNGLWDYAIVPANGGRPEKWEGKILVPFPVESALSGVMRRVPDGATLWYRRTFTPPSRASRWLLHFGASDWHTTVWVNGRKVGEHRGGYDPFSCDVTDALRTDESKASEQELVVAVSDPTDASYQPRGKQVRRPHGIWYTPTTGLWQTVWLEPVPTTYIAGVRFVPDWDKKVVRCMVSVVGPHADQHRVVVVSTPERPAKGPAPPMEFEPAWGQANAPLVVSLPNGQGWTPDAPKLYSAVVRLLPLAPTKSSVDDEVETYFALRKIALGPDDKGVLRLLLNDRPLFQYGTLDQGFWPDGLYTAPTDEALRYDIEVTKRLGFNLIRKHVKVEPARWYYWCDRLGLLVWQDMPSGDRSIGGKDPDIVRSPESAANFEREWTGIIDALRNHPSIVMWVPFNEGWGQFDTGRIVDFTRRLDPTRLVNGASGWTDRGVGDVHDVHIYPGPGLAPLSKTRASVLGEFGGLGLPLEGHTWQAKNNWGYRSFTNRDDLQKAYLGLMAALRPLIGRGLSAAIYTQTTDVEIEVNGLMTYDRAELKFDAAALAAAHRPLYLPPPRITPLVPTSEQAAQTWKYVTERPADGWQQPGFDDAAWKSGPGGFGEPTTPGAVVRTNWKSSDIWLRRTFDWPAFKPASDVARPRSFALRIHHDEDATVYLNGHAIASPKGFTTQYVELPLTAADERHLKPGLNTLAVHCRQTGGGQYIDVGLVVVEEETN